MVDVVGYMTVINDEGNDKRIIIVDPSNDKYTAKDRTGQLGKIIEPDFTKIIAACSGTEKFAWSKEQKVTETETKKEETEVTEESIESKIKKAKTKKA
jgi:inorganic pyrophosphatase